MFEDLEDDIELPQELIPGPRKFSRLKKAATVRNASPDNPKGADTPETEHNRSSLPEVLADGSANEHNEADPAEEPSNSGDSGNLDEAGSSSEEDEVDVDGAGGEPEDYEEDEEEALEQYYRRKANGEIVEEEDNAEPAQNEDSDDDPADADYQAGAPANLGPNATLEDLNAETQRILRETAARDRLGKGQKIEVRPLTGIVAKLKERRALAIARAPKPRFVDLPSFEDVLAASMPRSSPPSHPDKDQDGQADASPANEAVEKNGDVSCAGDSTPRSTIDTERVDLEVVTDNEAEEVVVELPATADRVGGRQTTPKASPLAFLPFAQSNDMDDFVDEAPLVDDGIESGDESDTDSDRSWEIRGEDVDKSNGNGAVTEKGRGRQTQDSAAQSPEASGSESSDDEMSEDERDADATAEKANTDGDAAPLQFSRRLLDENQNENLRADILNFADEAGNVDAGGLENAPKHSDDAPPSAFDALKAADAIPKAFKRVQRKFLDMEAELSDEEGAGALVSEDEEEDDVNDNGELADLVTSDRAVKKQDKDAVDELHLRWARQQDAKDLQQVLRGLENGFRRRRGGGLLEDDEVGVNGRRRRARLDGEDDDGNMNTLENFLFPGSLFGTGGGVGDEDCEDEAMLQKARQNKLLAGSQSLNMVSPGGEVPLDEDSQAVLGILLKSSTESQQGFGGPEPPGDNGLAGKASAGQSRMAMELFGSQASGALLRGPSFLGRQTAAVKTHGSGSLGLSGGRSFVFGRADSSNPASLQGEGGSGSEPTGPTTFANLRQMTNQHMPASGGDGDGGGKAEGCRNGKRGRGGASLVSRLKNGCGSNKSGSQESLDAAGAIWQQVALGAHNKKMRR